MLHGILRSNGHPFVMMGFLRNIEGIGPHIRFLLMGIRLDYLNKYYVVVIPLGANKFDVGGLGNQPEQFEE
ncbi:hypothetical protein Tco_0570767 [Tanacetum coccineum]